MRTQRQFEAVLDQVLRFGRIPAHIQAMLEDTIEDQDPAANAAMKQTAQKGAAQATSQAGGQAGAAGAAAPAPGAQPGQPTGQPTAGAAGQPAAPDPKQQADAAKKQATGQQLGLQMNKTDKDILQLQAKITGGAAKPADMAKLNTLLTAKKGVQDQFMKNYGVNPT